MNWTKIWALGHIVYSVGPLLTVKCARSFAVIRRISDFFNYLVSRPTTVGRGAKRAKVLTLGVNT